MRAFAEKILHKCIALALRHGICCVYAAGDFAEDGAMKGEIIMQGEAGRYKAEAGEKWQHTDAYREYAERTEAYSREKWDDLAHGVDGIMAAFAACMKQGETPDSSGAQALVSRLQEYISANFYRCTKEILAGLGEIYTEDERFRRNIDRHADGTAAFIREAISVYCAECA